MLGPRQVTDISSIVPVTKFTIPTRPHFPGQPPDNLMI